MFLLWNAELLIYATSNFEFEAVSAAALRNSNRKEIFRNTLLGEEVDFCRRNAWLPRSRGKGALNKSEQQLDDE